MDLTLDGDQRDLQAGLREYLARRWRADELRAASMAPESTAGRGTDRWRELAELGVFGVTLPEQAGGMGLGLSDAAVLFEELGAALVSGPLVTTVLAAGVVQGAATGDAVVTTLDAGSPVRLVEHLDVATHVVVMGADELRLVGPEELRAVPVETPLDPLTPVWQVPGDVDLAATGHRIGGRDEAADWFGRGAVLTAALQVGVARGALDLAARYAGERTQFGRPIGSFQAVKHLLAESLVRVELARAAVLVAALTIEDPEGSESDRMQDAVAAAKVLADDAATTNGRTGVQVHGGMGFTWEVVAHLYLKRAWVLETAFGTADEHAEALASAINGGDDR